MQKVQSQRQYKEFTAFSLSVAFFLDFCLNTWFFFSFFLLTGK